MVKKIDTAYVILWGEKVGAVTWLEEEGYSVFEYEPDFLKKNLDISPVTMPLQEALSRSPVFEFSSLSHNTYKGLPGLLSDSLPDKFGNLIIDAWLSRQGRTIDSFSPIERLCYIGTRGMGALEFKPFIDPDLEESIPIEISSLVDIVQEITHNYEKLSGNINGNDKEKEKLLKNIIQVGTSAGGARSKAIIAMDDKGNVVSGQVEPPEGYEHWLLKFDGVDDIELGESKSFGRIEYAYYLMAQDCGIDMMKSKIIEENNRAHFVTKRYDRVSKQPTELKDSGAFEEI